MDLSVGFSAATQGIRDIGCGEAATLPQQGRLDRLADQFRLASQGGSASCAGQSLSSSGSWQPTPTHAYAAPNAHHRWTPCGHQHGSQHPSPKTRWSSSLEYLTNLERAGIRTL